MPDVTLTTLQELKQRGEKIAMLTAYDYTMATIVDQAGVDVILVGDSARALKLSALLKDRGLLVGAIRPPTVPAGSARLRVTLSAAHSDAQLELLLEALAECWPQVQTDA